ncbi:Uncharacterised protein [Vibrio cholerae]|nr:Uncharacterised protein [Vibrio cholerae]
MQDSLHGRRANTSRNQNHRPLTLNIEKISGGSIEFNAIPNFDVVVQIVRNQPWIITAHPFALNRNAILTTIRCMRQGVLTNFSIITSLWRHFNPNVLSRLIIQYRTTISGYEHKTGHVSRLYLFLAYNKGSAITPST